MAESTFFSSSHGKLAKIDHILGNKTHHNTSKNIDIIQYLTTMELIKLKIIVRKLQNAQILNNALLDSTWVK